MKSFNMLRVVMLMVIFILFAGCAVSVDPFSEPVETVPDGYGVLSIDMPQLRGWTVSEYTVTATKSGETPVVATTTSSSVNMTLKLGTWNIDVDGDDEVGNLIFQGTASANVTQSGTSVTVGLLKKAGNFKLQVSNLASYTVSDGDPGAIARVIVTASKTGFPDIIQEVADFDSAILFSRLAQGDWSVSVEAQAVKLNSDYSQVPGEYTTYITGTYNETVLANKLTTVSRELDTQVKVTPVKFSHTSGTYSTDTTITLTCDTPGATISWTSDNWTTTNTFPVDPVSIDGSIGDGGTRTIQARASVSGMADSIVGQNGYTWQGGQTSTPQFNPAPGTYTSDINVVITCPDAGATITWTDDNWATSQAYSGSISVSGNGTFVTIEAHATVTGKSQSSTVSASYDIHYPQTAAPSISPTNGTYPSDQVITIDCGTPTATVYYTTDGTQPTTASTVYTGPFTIGDEGDYEIKAFAVAGGYSDSTTTTATYTLDDSASSSIVFTQADIIVIGDIWKDTSLVEGVNWYGIETTGTGAGTYLMEWTAGYNGLITIYENDLETEVTLNESTSSGTIDLGAARYFIKFNSTYTVDPFQVKVTYTGASTTTTTTTTTVAPTTTTSTTTTTLPAGITVHFEKPAPWGAAWIWYDDGSDGNWETTTLATPPGDMENYRTGWYRKVLPGSTTVTFLFNDGSWANKVSDGADDFVATADIWITDDGVKHTSDPETPTTTTTTIIGTTTTTVIGTTTTSTTTTTITGTYVERENNVILQGFYWYIPNPDSDAEDYTAETVPESDLWDFIAREGAETFYQDGFSHVWLPPTGKAFSPDANDYNVGYAVYDHYDLGEFDQMSHVRTKYGTKGKLHEAVNALHARKIRAVADIVMNHMLGGDDASMQSYSVSYNDSGSPLGSGSVESYIDFDFMNAMDANPRGTTYSNFVWSAEHFDGMENYGKYYLFSGKTLDSVNNFGDMAGPSEYQYLRSDIILGADLDLEHTAVQQEMKDWTEWLVEEVGFDGFRVDAIRHMHTPFVKDWASHMRNYMLNSRVNGGTVPADKLQIFGENWDGWAERLNAYLTGPANGGGHEYPTGDYAGIEQSMSLFDVPLHYDFQKVAGENTQSLDISQLPSSGILGTNGNYSITFVDNHDTVPTEMLASYIPLHTKMQAYTFILLNQYGTPCVYYRDFYKGNFTSEYTNDNYTYLHDGITKLLEVRHQYAYGAGSYYDYKSGVLGYKRAGDGAHPGSGCIYVIKGHDYSGDTSLNIPDDGRNWVLYAGDGGRSGSTFWLNGDSRYAVWVPQN
jgi:alpha-amylase